MPLLQVIVLAVVQGLTEFLPISSTAHLYLTSWLFGWQLEGLDFDIALHLGTLLAVLLYFARDWVQIVEERVAGGRTGFRYRAAPRDAARGAPLLCPRLGADCRAGLRRTHEGR